MKSFGNRFILPRIRRIRNNLARKKLNDNSSLWNNLNDYLKLSHSTGCNLGDYWELYKAIRLRRPMEVLECGTGVSTIVIAHALQENQKEGFPGRVLSLEESIEYYKCACAILPQQYSSVVEIMLKPVVEDTYSLFRGVRYDGVPDRKYDFVFVDGPAYKAPSDGMLCFDFDFIDIVRKSDTPVYGLVDKRVSTCYVLQKVFGYNKIKYNALLHLGFCGPCTRHDLMTFDKLEPSRAFNRSFSWLGNSKLDVKFSKERILESKA